MTRTSRIAPPPPPTPPPPPLSQCPLRPFKADMRTLARYVRSVPFADQKRSSNQKRSARTRPHPVRKIQRNTSLSNEAIDVDVKHPSRHIHGVARNLRRKGEARWSRCAFVINSTPTRLLASEIISRTSNALSNAAAARQSDVSSRLTLPG